MAGVCIPINCLVKSSTESLGWCARTHKSQFHIWRMYIVGARFSGKQMLKRSLKPRNGGFSLWYGILSRSISIRNLHLDLRCWGWSVPYPDNARDPWIPTIHQTALLEGHPGIHYPFRISSGLKTLLLHPGRLTWNLQITHFERKMIFQTSMIMVHVNLPGCKPTWPWENPPFSMVFIDLEKMEIFPWLCFGSDFARLVVWCPWVPLIGAASMVFPMNTMAGVARPEKSVATFFLRDTIFSLKPVVLQYEPPISLCGERKITSVFMYILLYIFLMYSSMFCVFWLLPFHLYIPHIYILYIYIFICFHTWPGWWPLSSLEVWVA